MGKQGKGDTLYEKGNGKYYKKEEVNNGENMRVERKFYNISIFICIVITQNFIKI